MTIVSPSLLSCDFLNIEKELRAFDSIKDIWFHLDIMDGHFVPNLTFGHPIIEMIAKKTTHKLDAHFMVLNPEFYIDTLKDVPLHNFTFHFEADATPERLIKKAKQHFPSVGISIKPRTPVSVLSDELLKNVDLVLMMSVEPGFGGQAFMELVYDKLDQLNERRKKLGLNFVIQVDGGVSDKNAKKLIEHGVNNLVAGSYVFKEGPAQYQNKINSLR